MLNIPRELRAALIIGAFLFLATILLLLRRKRLNVQYSIIWLGAALAMMVFALFPGLVAMLGDVFGIVMPANLVFTMLFVFLLLLLLSLSIIATGFSKHIKQLTQTQALLEERVRQLEAQLKTHHEDSPQ